MVSSEREINRHDQRERCARKACRRLLGPDFRLAEAADAVNAERPSAPQATFELRDSCLSPSDANLAAHELENWIRSNGPGFMHQVIDSHFCQIGVRWWHSDLVSKDNLLTICSDETADGHSGWAP